MNKNTTQHGNRGKFGKTGIAARLKIMDFIANHQEVVSNVTLDDIARGVGMVKTSVHYHIKMLVREGIVTKPARSSRGIKIAKSQSEILKLNVCDSCELVVLGDGKKHVCMSCEKPMIVAYYMRIPAPSKKGKDSK